MDSHCSFLQVDVNGEATFFVDKRILWQFSGKLSRLFGMSTCNVGNLKIVFGDFLGGAESFELILRFCYSNGELEISPANMAFLHSAARYMEMRDPVSGVDNLVGQTRNALEEIKDWTWFDLLALLKQCQELNLVATLSGSSFLSFLEKCLESVVRRVASSGEPSPSPSTSSSDSLGLRFSCETKGTVTTTTESLKSSFSRATWWFEDLLFINTTLLERLVHSMISQKFDHGVISKFLLYYHKSKSQFVKPRDKCEIVDVVVDLLYDLKRGCVSCKGLFDLLRMALTLDLEICTRNKLEVMIGWLMDRATLDNLLIPSPAGTNHLYDVDLVLRLLTAFQNERSNRGSITQLKKVASLLDAYLAEVAPDPLLRPSKFLALAMSLPDLARDSYDNVYRAMGMYMEVHTGLSEVDKVKMCGAMNYVKLSVEAYKDITRNPKFPFRNLMQARISPCRVTKVNSKVKTSEMEPQKHIVLYAGGLDLPSDNEKLRTQLQGMQSRVTELEKVCQKMQIQMAKMPKTRAATRIRSLPRLCS